MTDEPKLRPDEQKFLFRLRVASIVVMLICVLGITFATLTQDIFHLHGSEALAGIFVGAILLQLQVEGAARLPGRKREE